jgi:hypothetical protein
LIRSILTLSGLSAACVALAACASSEPDEQQPTPPVVVKSTWDDASGHHAPIDSLWRELHKALSRRTDIAVAEKEPSPDENKALSHRGPRGGAGGGGGEFGGGGGPGGGGPGGGGPGGGPGGGGSSEEKPPTPALVLLLAATVDQWDVSDPHPSAVDDPKFQPPSDSGRVPVKLSLRLVSKATGRVVWKTTEECTPAANVADTLSRRFDACREEFLRKTAQDVAQGALDLARRAANPTPPRHDR